MAAPGTREIDAVSKLGELEPEVLERLNLVLKALGFGSAEVAEMLAKGIAETTAILNGETPLTGPHLVAICVVIGVRPGVIQGNRHFDRTETATKGKAWKGPHKLFIEGHSNYGGHFQTGYNQVQNKPDVGSALKNIARGNHPVSIAQLQHLFRSLTNQKIKITGGLLGLKQLMDSMVPSGVVTVDSYRQQRAAAAAPIPPVPEQGAGMSDQAAGAPEIVWSEDEESVQIGATTYSLHPGPDMAKVAVRVRKLIAQLPDKPKINVVLGACGVPLESERAQVLANVEKHKGTFSGDAVRNLANFFNIPVEALFNGVGLGITDPVTGATAPTGTGGIDQLYFKEQMLHPDVRLAAGADMREVLRLHVDDRSGAEIDWIDAWLRLHEDGVRFQKNMEIVLENVRHFGPQTKALAVRMILDSNGDVGEPNT